MDDEKKGLPVHKNYGKPSDDRAEFTMLYTSEVVAIFIPKSKVRLIAETNEYYILGEVK